MKRYARGRVSKVELPKGEMFPEKYSAENIIRRGVCDGRSWIKYYTDGRHAKSNCHISFEDAYQVILNDNAK
jgi:hypothetical protein